MAHVLSVNLAAARTYGAWAGDQGSTGIDKRPVAHRVRFCDDHVEGDTVVDMRHHGGTHKAVYAYAHEDARWWEYQTGKELTPGVFGENLTTVGIDLNQLEIGTQLAVGSALLEVSEPRIPCRVFAGFWDRPQLIKEFSAANRPGTYLRIIHDGEIAAGDEITMSASPSHSVTVEMAYRAKNGNGITAAQLIPALNDFSPEWQSWIARMTESQTSSGTAQ